MKDRKGFTLIEVLAAVIILGILLVITVPTFTKYLKGFRIDYYERLEGNINTSGQTFFADNRSYRPIGLLETSIVKLGTLDSEKYIENISDYNGSSCDIDSYVIVIKEGKGKYHYETCLKCSKDDYESEKDYCNEAWKNNDNLEYVLEEGPVIYVYQGTPRSELKEKLKIKAWVQKTDGMGNILATIDGREDETGEVPEIYPDDIDTVNTDVIGEYPVTYTYGSKTTTGKVVVYNNSSPMIVITKTNNGDVTSYDSTNSEDWGQKLTFEFSVVDSNELDELEQSGSSITAIQWRRATTKKWEDFCTNIVDNKCIISTEIEMNEKVDFRFVTNQADYSNISSLKIRIDNTAPVVDLTRTGTLGIEDWYRSNITYGFDKTKTKDIVGSSGNLDAISGLKKYGISTNNPMANRKLSGLFNISSSVGLDGTNSQTTDTSGTTWYIYVEDKAENIAVVSHNAKRDTIKPTISWNNPPVDGSGNKIEYEKKDKLNVVGSCVDERSGTYTEPVDVDISSPTTSSGVVVTHTCTDKAGNVKTFSGTFYVKQWYDHNEGKCGCAIWNTEECCCTTCGGGCNSYAPTFSCPCHSTGGVPGAGTGSCQCGGECNGYAPTYECGCQTINTTCREAASCWAYG